MGIYRWGSFALLVAFTAGCQRHHSFSPNYTVPTGGVVQKEMGETEKFSVVDLQTAKARLNSGSVIAPESPLFQSLTAGISKKFPGNQSSPPASPRSPLILGFPLGLLGENHVFGGVITAVSDTANEKLGGLKLTDLPPLHVKPLLGTDSAGNTFFALQGCAEKCGEGAEEDLLVTLPILGVDSARALVMLDIAGLGDELNLLKLIDPQGSYTQLKTKTNLTKAFDYSFSTLVFDVETTMEPLVGPAANTTFNVRWYLRLASTFDPAFVSRTPASGVGFFLTERTDNPKIQRFAIPSKLAGTDRGTVHYYLKGVPSEYQAGFKAAFDDWNGYFVGTIGKKLLSFEFVPPTDPRYALLVTGDVRYNIVEWDTVNTAGYGGLGPSIANQHTGEILSANVLVQGPTIVSLYTQWFKTAKQVAALKEQGEFAAAERLLVQTLRELEHKAAKAGSFSVESLKLGALPFTIHSKRSSLEDPLWQRNDFEPVPAGMDYASYMEGYFHDLVAHELGHNLGLRHNFRGNLGAGVTPATGAVSRSIMEYLGRAFRYLSRIGNYDAMAIAYGYAGKRPSRTDLFCTDEEVGDEENPEGSAECSRDDATPNPFGYFEQQVRKGVNRLVDAGTSEAPLWTVPDMQRELGNALRGIGLYGSSVQATSTSWTNFFADPSRPRNPTLIRGYVLARLREGLCGRHIEAALSLKATPQALAAAEANVAALRTLAEQKMAALGAFTPSELRCQ